MERAQGVRLGRSTVLGADVATPIVTAHKAGASWSAIARQFNEECVATARGAVASVDRSAHRARARAEEVS